jgi:hypothetical protein
MISVLLCGNNWSIMSNIWSNLKGNEKDKEREKSLKIMQQKHYLHYSTPKLKQMCSQIKLKQISS